MTIKKTERSLYLRRGSLVSQSEDFDCMSIRVTDTLQQDITAFDKSAQPMMLKLRKDLKEIGTPTTVKNEIMADLERMKMDHLHSSTATSSETGAQTISSVGNLPTITNAAQLGNNENSRK